MIPVFFRDLAALVRQHVAASQAVHVTIETAQELDLLAGLPWDRAYPDLPPAPGWNRLPTPADIALGWLLASKAMPSYGEIRYDIQCDRAAVCAELAVLAARWTTESPRILLANPHLGTKGGARAAWAFICQAFEGQTPPLGFPGNEQQLSRDARFREIRDTYRRELEAMK